MIRDEILQSLRRAVKKSGYKLAAEILVERPKDQRFGDYSTNIAMVLAKSEKSNPQKIAQKISQNFAHKNVEVKIASGFINFGINPLAIQELSKVLCQKEQYFQLELGKDLKVNVEFISANPTGPLHLGNGRGGFCGDALSRVFTAYGSQVDREYYVNDRGAQIETLGHSILKDKDAVYQGDYIDKLHTKIKNQKSKIKNIEEIGEWGAHEILEKYIKKTIKKMGIKFNKYFSEKSLFDNYQIENFLGILQKKGHIGKKDGAKWFISTHFADDKDRVVQRKNGSFTYFASDISYHANKIERGYDLCINFWGADHAGYAKRLDAAVNSVLKEDFRWQGEFKIILFQLVRLVKNGKEVRMSKRAGNIICLDELLTEVGADAARFFFLMHSYNNHMNFDMGLAKKKSKENPVYYVQYAHARIQSIFAKSNISSASIDLSLLRKDEEINLAKEIIRLPELIEDIVRDYQVHRLPYYAISLADKFHIFYENCRVIDKKNKELSSVRLALCKAAQIALKNTLDLMGISAPKKM